MAELRALPHVVMVDVDALAKEHSMPKCANGDAVGGCGPLPEHPVCGGVA